MALKAKERIVGVERRGMEKLVYGECRKNHAAQLGSHSIDGCCEFSPNLLPGNPILCAACGCHRNFHRRLTMILLDDEPENGTPTPGNGGSRAKTSEGVEDHGKQIVEVMDLGDRKEAAPLKPRASARPRVVILRKQKAAIPALEGRKEEEAPLVKPRGNGKKPRTMFTAKQKEMMRAFSDSLGWTVARKDSRAEVNKFCQEVGVTRYVFRTWLNNNKKIYGN